MIALLALVVAAAVLLALAELLSGLAGILDAALAGIARLRPVLELEVLS